MAKNKQDSHEKLANRLAMILQKLNAGEKLEIEALAHEFGVTVRTIQRDLNERFSFLPLKKIEIDGKQRIALEDFYLGKIPRHEIENFAIISGVKALYPALNNQFLRRLLDETVSQAYLVKGHHYEDLSVAHSHFPTLEQAILERNEVSFLYNGKHYTGIKPYKLLNYKGIWYLVGVDEEKIKSFSLTKITLPEKTTVKFIRDTDVLKTIEDEDSIYFSETKREVILKVNKDIAEYFKRRDLIPNQIIEKELQDGSLLVSSRVAHDNQILSIVKYWIPNIIIISPEDLQQKLHNELKTYMAIR